MRCCLSFFLIFFQTALFYNDQGYHIFTFFLFYHVFLIFNCFSFHRQDYHAFLSFCFSRILLTVLFDHNQGYHSLLSFLFSHLTTLFHNHQGCRVFLLFFCYHFFKCFFDRQYYCAFLSLTFLIDHNLSYHASLSFLFFIFFNSPFSSSRYSRFSFLFQFLFF